MDRFTKIGNVLRKNTKGMMAVINLQLSRANDTDESLLLNRLYDLSLDRGMGLSFSNPAIQVGSLHKIDVFVPEGYKDGECDKIFGFNILKHPSENDDDFKERIESMISSLMNQTPDLQAIISYIPTNIVVMEREDQTR